MAYGNRAASPAIRKAAEPAPSSAFDACHIAASAFGRKDDRSRQVIEKCAIITLRKPATGVDLAAILPKLPITSEVLTSSAAILALDLKGGRPDATRRIDAPVLGGTCGAAHARRPFARGRLLEGHDVR